MRQISLSALPAQTFTVILDGQNCVISLYQRGKSLYLDLEADGNAVCKGAICRNRADTLQSRASLFSGTLHFWDTEGSSPPQWEDLGSRHLLLYAPKDEELPAGLRF